MQDFRFQSVGMLPKSWIGTTRTDWMDEIFRTAFYQRHNVALNVGSDNFSNRISFAYDNDEGVLINTFKKNLTLRYNGKMQLNKWVSVSEDFVGRTLPNVPKLRITMLIQDLSFRLSTCRQVPLSIIRWTEVMVV